MKILTPCTHCFFEDGIYEVLSAEMNNDGLFKLDCANGHSSLTILQIEKFEALFDIGVDSLINGYKTEAVASFSTSLERFYEWFIRVILTKNNIDYDLIDESWKPLANASERQLGAFLLIFLNEFNECAPKVDTNQSGFRNKVLHKGYLPSYEEAFDYGSYVLTYIRTVLNRMGDHSKDYYQVPFLNKIKELAKNHTELQRTTMVMPTVIGLLNNSNNSSMNEAIRHIKSRGTMNEFMKNLPSDFSANL